jgi:hypothetical protein
MSFTRHSKPVARFVVCKGPTAKNPRKAVDYFRQACKQFPFDRSHFRCASGLRVQDGRILTPHRLNVCKLG